MNLTADFVAVHAVGAVVALSEVDEPGGLSSPVAETFTGHVEVVPHVGMED